jgi:hypothetical protein
MKLSTTKKGAILASAVAAMFSACATAPVSKGDAVAGSVKCGGVNSCKGQGSCSGASNSCKGQNTCKGQGWVPTATEQDCIGRGGTVASAR